MSKAFNEKVKTALKEIEQEKRHEEMHNRIIQEVSFKADPSDKLQIGYGICGLCSKRIKVCIPPMTQEIL